MYISLAHSRANGFRRWSDAHQPLRAADHNHGGFARGDATAIVALNSDDVVLTAPERPHGPWLIPGVGNTL